MNKQKRSQNKTRSFIKGPGWSVESDCYQGHDMLCNECDGLGADNRGTK